MPTWNDSTKRAFIVQSVKRKMIYDDRTLAAGATPENLGNFCWIPRFGTITPIELDVSYGLGDDPIDELISWFLSSVDVDNLPDLAALRSDSPWGAMQSWRTIGTDSGPVQTLTREVQDFLNPPTFGFDELAGWTQRQAVALIGASTTTSRMITLATLTYFETKLQRVYTSDDQFADLGEDNWNDFCQDMMSDA